MDQIARGPVRTFVKVGKFSCPGCPVFTPNHYLETKIDGQRQTDGRREGVRDGRTNGWIDGWVDTEREGRFGGRDREREKEERRNYVCLPVAIR